MKTLMMVSAMACGMCALQDAQATMITIGNAGNAADVAWGGGQPKAYGAVGYIYQISQYEVTGAEFGAAVASDSRIGSSTPNSGNNPAASVNWYEAAKYCNFLTSGDAYTGVYQFDGLGNLTTVDRTAAISTYGGKTYALPTDDEWYKAAYYTGTGYSLYANGTGTAPVAGTEANYLSASTWVGGTGAVEQNGTYDMMGNVMEWNESAYDMVGNFVLRGGEYNNTSSHQMSSNISYAPATYEDSTVGFRIVAIPEPSTAALAGLAGLGLLAVRRFRFGSSSIGLMMLRSSVIFRSKGSQDNGPF
ncbi:MAG: SUMF1/EgtB/PvdO family nonheme iron enzyme [Kiritimatiellales bacterium]|nr:SUMF1/EgtB/PvdO family nonheme iron enzyme [Kiritimatiellales bacterium]MCF7863938.1 SUMF1/EgtB/PvdO family nonheme iron enzyme [Kiritimatiellales bacterium]